MKKHPPRPFAKMAYSCSTECFEPANLACGICGYRIWMTRQPNGEGGELPHLYEAKPDGAKVRLERVGQGAGSGGKAGK